MSLWSLQNCRQESATWWVIFVHFVLHETGPWCYYCVLHSPVYIMVTRSLADHLIHFWQAVLWVFKSPLFGAKLTLLEKRCSLWVILSISRAMEVFFCMTAHQVWDTQDRIRLHIKAGLFEILPMRHCWTLHYTQESHSHDCLPGFSYREATNRTSAIFPLQLESSCWSSLGL